MLDNDANFFILAEARGGATKNSSKTPEKATSTHTTGKEKKTKKKNDKGKARAAPSAKDKPECTYFESVLSLFDIF